jgi:hypothetical protein
MGRGLPGLASGRCDMLNGSFKRFNWIGLYIVHFGLTVEAQSKDL